MTVFEVGSRRTVVCFRKRCPPYHPNEQKRSSGTPVSDDETVAKMGHPVLWKIGNCSCG
jgi:hypothetical protein